MGSSEALKSSTTPEYLVSSQSKAFQATHRSLQVLLNDPRKRISRLPSGRPPCLTRYTDAPGTRLTPDKYTWESLYPFPAFEIFTYTLKVSHILYFNSSDHFIHFFSLLPFLFFHFFSFPPSLFFLFFFLTLLFIHFFLSLHSFFLPPFPFIRSLPQLHPQTKHFYLLYFTVNPFSSLFTFFRR